MTVAGNKAKERPLVGKRIGLLEYDHGNRRALEHLLSNAGAEVLTLSLPLDHERINTENYDLLVIGDLERNNIGQLESLCLELKYQGHSSYHIPVIVISSLGMNAEEEAQRLKNAGAEAVFRKPYETRELMEAAAKLALSPGAELKQPVVLEPAPHEKTPATVSH